MIVQRYYAGWSFARVGTFSFAVTNDADGDAYTATFTTGSYYHGLLADTGVGFDHSAFATALATALDNVFNANEVILERVFECIVGGILS